MAPISINGTTGIAGVDGSAAAPALQGSDTNTGIAFGSDVILGSTGGTERFRVDSSGKLLVGTSTSLTTKYVAAGFEPGFQNAANAGTGGFFRFSADGDPPAFVLNKSRNASTGSHTVVNSGDIVGYIGFAGSDGTDFETAATIKAEVDGTPGANDMPGRLVFSTTADGASSPTERMRIKSTGETLVGTSSEWFDRSFVVENSQQSAAFLNSNAAAYPVSIMSATTSGDNLFVGFWTEGRGTPAGRGSIDFNRAAGQIRYNVTSDQRLKSEIQSAPSAINLLSSIQVRSYKWTETGHQVEYGFIAQELNQLVPDAVKEGDDGDEVVDAWSVDNTKLVPLLTKALQEALTEISLLKDRVAVLESA